MKNIKIIISFLLFPFQAVAVNDQGFIPLNKGGYSANIDMRQLFAQGQITGTLTNFSGLTKVSVYPTCKVWSNAYNYFSSKTLSDDPTMILDSASGYIAENSFLKVKVWGSLGTNENNYVAFPWNTTLGPGSNTFSCDNLSSWGIYTAKNIKYEIIRKRPFSTDEQFKNIRVLIFGGRQVDIAGTLPNISTATGDEISILTLNFINWFTPYTCSVQMDKSNGEISFGTNTVGKLIAGIEKKYFTLTTKCNTTTSYDTDALAVNVQFASDITPAGQSSFNTINTETNQVSNQLVFVITNETQKEVVKNIESAKLSLPSNTTKTEFTKVIQYSVQPKWIGGSAENVPLGGYESSGIIYLNLE
ncbi:hypothetical protein [Klebsiella pasteurii]|uniref:hypothetical protein n=1 Tax=Klebsiella pasteurii TaxID=2587529 RepID=UPI0011585E1E|nr:hypothetical protein [Klebsiella pasteurii]VUS85492.1 hypothetical protein SB6416_05408 [Klebsiella pasteurii]VUS87124.1 hypothetical protein SB6424_05423 [Klebsiella pasteurii]